MIKSLKLLTLLFVPLLLFGCQNVASGKSENLQQDALTIYSAIEKNGLDGEYLNSDYQQKIDEFNSNYVEKYNSFNQDEKEIIVEMDKLINSYKLYFVSMGTNGNDANGYKDKINNSLSILSTKLNN